MKLLQLRYFHEACRLNSISRAAESLHVSQPSVSMAIKELEREFGVFLISRRYKGFTLTPEGEQMRNMADNLLRHADNISEKMFSLSQQRKRVRLGTPPMVGSMVLPAIYGKIAKFYPDIIFSTEEMGSKTCMRNLQENSLDMAFVVHNQPIPGEYETVPISDLEIVWCTSPTHTMAKRKEVSLQEIEREPLVFFQSGFSLSGNVLRQYKELGIEPNIVHQTAQLSTVRALIQSGAATGFLFDFAAQRTTGIVIHRLKPVIRSSISLIWPKAYKPFSNRTKFIDCCREAFIIEK